MLDDAVLADALGPPQRCAGDADLGVGDVAADQVAGDAEYDRLDVVAGKGIAAAGEDGRVGRAGADRSDEPAERGDIKEKGVIHFAGEETDPARRIGGDGGVGGGAGEV